MADTTHTGTLADPRPAVNSAEIAALSEHLGETSAERDRRRAVADRYRTAAFPDRVLHRWRFTDPTSLLPDALGAQILAGADVEAEPSVAVDGAAVTIDLWPGRAPLVTRSDEDAAASISVEPASPSDEIDGNGGLGDPSRLFRLLNEAVWNAGAEIRIASGAEPVGPIHVRIHAAGPATLPRLRVIAGANASATVVEDHCGGGADGLVVGNTDLDVGDGAHLRHVVLQSWEPGTRGFLALGARVRRDADLLSVFGSFGGDRVKVEMDIRLEDKGARSEIIGVALGTDRQRCDLHTGHRHLAGNTWSNIDFKAVMSGSARSSYTGLIRIEKAARSVEAYQTNRNLLLTNRAHADAIPELEILNEEVSCSHGATVAPVDASQLFYLQSRGLRPDQALRLVVRGFLEKTLRSLPESLRPSVEAIVEQRLEAWGREA